MSITAEPEIADRQAGRGMNLVAFAKPYFGLIVLTTVLLSAFGLYSMFRMPSGIYPEVAFPRIVVIVQSPGLAVKDVEVAVTRPIEEAVSIVLGVIRVRSKTVRGAAELSIDFAPGTDMIQALNDIRARMAEVGSQLPPGTTSITERQTPSVFPIISFVVTGGRDPASLHDYAFYDLRPRISRLADVSYVTVQGGDIREILVEVDPQALVAAELSIADVADRLGKEHRLKAVGRLDREVLQYQVLADTQATDPLELENRVIASKNGQSIRLRDLGRVVISHADRTMVIRANGQNAVALTVFRRLGGNALQVSRELDLVLADAAKSAPPGVSIRPVYDQGLLVKTAIANVRDAIVIGGAFSVLILLMFLKSLRATLIAALSIPLSLIISFVFLHLTGDTLNLMSLGGLAVAIGLIIDDTVVVIENIARHLAEGQTGDAAVDRASKEISGAVIGSTLTTILVFLPLAFLRGVVGQFFQSLSLALSVALLVSMVVSLTIIPVLAARFLGRRPMPSSGPIYNVLANSYEGMLKVGLRFPRLTVLLALLAVIPGWWLAAHLQTGFMPEMDEGAFVLDYNMPVGTSLSQTDKVLRRVEKVLLDTPDVQGYIRRTGAELGFFATESFTGDILVSLKPPGQRRPMEEIFDALREELKASVPELETEFKPLVMDQIDDLAGVQEPIEVKVFGPEPATLRELAAKVGEIVEKVAGVVDVNTHVRLGNPDIVVRPDSVQTAQRWPHRARRGEPAQRRPLRPGSQHGPRAGSDDQDPGPLSRPGTVRPGKPGPVAHKSRNGHGLSDLASTGHARGRGDRLCPARPARVDPGRAQPERIVEGEPATRPHGDREARQARCGLREPRAPVRALGARVPAGLPLGARRELPGTARVVCKPADGPHCLGGARLPPPGIPVPQLVAADPHLPGTAGVAGQRALRPLGDGHPTERLVVHGGHPADRPGREERHHPDRVHRPAPRPGNAAP